MQKILIVKYAELNTKKDNIGMFLRTLKENIMAKTKDLANITFDKGRMFLKTNEEDFTKVLTILQKTFGIHEIMVGYQIEDTSLETIEEAILTILKEKDFKTFKVETKRSDKSYPLTSLEISKKLGGFILKNKENVLVNVHTPEVTFYVEIRKDYAYLYFNKIKGLGGYPVGTLGKGLLMLSGGIDSPVAGFLGMKRGVKIEAIYFESPPHTSEEAKNKVLSLANILNEYSGKIKLHIVPFTQIQEAIFKNCPDTYMITIMRRMMYRIAAKYAEKIGAKILINGESIGQVASQTLESISCINNVTNMPVIRPVACYDKLEIIALSKKINTYETSILPYEDCCTVFVPKHPVIKPELEKCEEYEKRFDYDSLIEKAIDNIEVITNFKEEKFDDIL